MNKCNFLRNSCTKKWTYNFMAFLLFMIFVVALSGFTVNAQNSKVNVQVEGTKYYNYADEMFKIINQEREKEGLEPLAFDKELTETAMQRCAEIAISFSHTRPDGSSCFTANSRLWGENISVGYPTPQSAMEGFMTSQGHKENVLNVDFKSVGVGCVVVDGTTYWTQCYSYNKSAVITDLPSNELSEFEIEVLCDNLDLKIKEGSELTISANKTKQLNLYSINKNYSYSKCTIKSNDIVWESDNNNVCRVDNKGLITAVGEGTTQIRCYLGDNCIEIKVIVSRAYILESNHPYDNLIDETYTLNYDNAESIEFTFTQTTELEKNYDVIYIYDKENNLIGKYTGTELAGKTIKVNGDTVYIKLKTDLSVNKYGFAIEDVKVNYSNKLSIKSFTSSKSIIDLGSSVKLTASAEGNNIKYKFAYYYKSKWTVIQDYSSKSTITWNPKNAGTYKIRLFVSNGTDILRKDIDITVKDITFKSDKYNISLGQSVNLSATTSGSNLQYKFAYTRTGKSWSVIQPYSNQSDVVWKPKYKGTYTVRLFVLDGTNIYRKDITIIVS